MTPGELLRRAAAEPTPPALVRVEARIRLTGGVLRAAAVEPSTVAVGRVLARAHRPRGARTRVPALGVAFLLPLGFAIYVMTPRFSARDLAAPVPTSASLSPEVAVRYAGEGRVDGERKDLVIHWQIGTLETDVEPARGVHLAVVTDEARVVVHGTVFSVDRTALGTAATVTRGEVEVTCGVGAPVILRAGEHAWCLPMRASGELARARELRNRGAGSMVVLGVIERGANLPDASPAVLGELLALRIDVLVAAGDDVNALISAEQYLAAGYTPRRAEVESIAVTLRTKNVGSGAGHDPSSTPEKP